MKNLGFWITAAAVFGGVGAVASTIGDEGRMPDLDGAVGWLNSAPLNSKRSRAEDGPPRFLCDASAISYWRLRDVEVHCVDPKVSVEVTGIWVRHGGEVRHEFEPQPGDIVASEHWASSGFANRDLDLQLKNHGIHKLIMMGLIAHTCVRLRFAMPLSLGTRSRW